MAYDDNKSSISSVFSEDTSNDLTKFNLKPMQDFNKVIQELKDLRNSPKKEILFDLSLFSETESDSNNDTRLVEVLMPLLLDPKVKTIIIPRAMIPKISGKAKGYLLEHFREKFGTQISILGHDIKVNNIVNTDFFTQKLSVHGRTAERNEEVKVTYKVLNNIEEYVPLYEKLVKLCHKAAQYGNLKRTKRKWESPKAGHSHNANQFDDDIGGSTSDTDSEEFFGYQNPYKKKKCYVCKNRYFLSDFQDNDENLRGKYSRLCLSCAKENDVKRKQKADMTDKVVIVTGGRIKIGFETALKLLRDGAKVIVTTRFPRDALERYSKQPDFDEFSTRLKICPLDMKNIRDIYRFVNFVKVTEAHLDVLINNAAQTLYRPINFYQHLLEAETQPIPEELKTILADKTELLQFNTKNISDENEEGGNTSSFPDHKQTDEVTTLDLDEFEGPPQKRMKLNNSSRETPLPQTPVPTTSNEVMEVEYKNQSSNKFSSESEYCSHGNQHPFLVSTLFPRGQYDHDGQQLDLRRNNSWRTPLEDVPLPELLEVLMINTVAPFILNKELKSMLMKSPHQKKFIVNVSAMEGQFKRKHKTMYHPHTNMAKAALNMMTRTAAIGYQKEGIYMTSVDTGWVSDERPHHMAKNEEKKGFILPLDSVDGAARVYDPIVHGLANETPYFAVFLKNYKPYPW